jgi:hypothetical protein
MMPPAGYSVRCVDEPDKVYRWTENELRYYPSGQIASSWNTAWREDLVQIDCTSIPMGSPMSMNFGSLTMSRAADGFSEVEVYSVRCLDEPDRVYCWHEGELHHYPTGVIASSWDKDWQEALVELDCSNIPIGKPMSSKIVNPDLGHASMDELATSTPTVAPTLNNDNDPLKKYNFTPFKDSSGYDIKRSSANSIEGIAKECDSYANCKGFNSNGWIKYYIRDASQWGTWTNDPSRGFYQKQSQVY